MRRRPPIGPKAIFWPSARSKNLTFRLELSPGLPELVKFDRKRLRQVIVNILGFRGRRAGNSEAGTARCDSD